MEHHVKQYKVQFEEAAEQLPAIEKQLIYSDLLANESHIAFHSLDLKLFDKLMAEMENQYLLIYFNL